MKDEFRKLDQDRDGFLIESELHDTGIVPAVRGVPLKRIQIT